MPKFARQVFKPDSMPEAARAKWSDSVLTEGFVPFPKKLIRCLHGLFPGTEQIKELSALLAVIDFKRAAQIRNPTADYLAFIAGLSESDFLAALERLAEKDYIRFSADAEGIEANVQPFIDAIKRETQLT